MRQRFSTSIVGEAMRVYLIGLLALVLPVALCGQTVNSYTSGGYTLYYEEIGRGPALYILSGGPGEAPDTPYRQIADSLSRHFTCVLVHQRASGQIGRAHV